MKKQFQTLAAVAAVAMSATCAVGGFIISGYPVDNPSGSEASEEPCLFTTGRESAEALTESPLAVNWLSWAEAPLERRFSSYPAPFLLIIK